MSRKKPPRRVAPPHELPLTWLAESATKGTDLACALMCGAFVENATGALLEQCMIADPKPNGGSGPISQLNSPQGILSTASARSNMCYCLGLIDKEIHANAKIIAEIRNRFAHSHAQMDFGDEFIRGFCSDLKLMAIEGTGVKPGRPISAKSREVITSKPRLKLVLATCWTFITIHAAVYNETIQDENGEEATRIRKRPKPPGGKFLLNIQSVGGWLTFGEKILLEE